MPFDFYDHGICISLVRVVDLSREPLNYFHSFPGCATMLLRAIKLPERTLCQSSIRQPYPTLLSLSYYSFGISPLNLPRLFLRVSPSSSYFPILFPYTFYISCLLPFRRYSPAILFFSLLRVPFSGIPFSVIRHVLSLSLAILLHPCLSSVPLAPFSSIYRPIDRVPLLPFSRCSCSLPLCYPFSCVNLFPSTQHRRSGSFSRPDFTPPSQKWNTLGSF